MFTCFCSFVLYPRAQSRDVRGIEGLTRRFTVICFHSDVVMSQCCCTKDIHVRTTLLAGPTTPQVLEFQGIQGLPYKIPNEIPNALSRPLLNRKQAST